jgi:hypothetical protein
MVMDLVHSSVDHGRHQSTVDHGQGLDGVSSEDGRNDALVRGTSPQLRKKGEEMMMILTGCKWGGGGTEMAGRRWGITGGRGAWARREEKRGGERSGEARGWCSPFIGAREGHTGARKGEMVGGNGLNAIEGMAA